MMAKRKKENRSVNKKRREKIENLSYMKHMSDSIGLYG
jgi:hypothetical protein